MIEKNPNDAKAWFGKGLLLYQLGRKKEAKNILRLAKNSMKICIKL